MCGSGARWCARADAIFDVPDMHVLDVEIDHQQRLVLTIESGQLEAACPACGVLAVGHGRRVRILHDAPFFGRVTVLRWLVRMWRCREPLCRTTTFTESHDLAPPRMVLTTRAVDWATGALSWDDTTVSALARQLGVDWHTCWDGLTCQQAKRKMIMTLQAGDKLMSLTDVSEMLGIPVHTLYRWRYKGDGPVGYRVGRHVRYRREAVEAWLEQQADQR
jgi:excisionase family DNA binding protein